VASPSRNKNNVGLLRQQQISSNDFDLTIDVAWNPVEWVDKALYKKNTSPENELLNHDHAHSFDFDPIVSPAFCGTRARYIYSNIIAFPSHAVHQFGFVAVGFPFTLTGIS
jgi:hypothetical protein